MKIKSTRPDSSFLRRNSTKLKDVKQASIKSMSNIGKLVYRVITNKVFPPYITFEGVDIKLNAPVNVLRSL